MSQRFPGRRLSLPRLALLLLVLAAVGYGGVSGVRAFHDGRNAAASDPWFGAYVDVTASPTFRFENPDADTGHHVVLGFVVARSPDSCEASWGTYHSLSEAHTAVELDRRVARLRQFGGEVVISFGGQANSELALACTTDELVEQYREVIDRYEPAALDFDIEGEALADVDSRHRRIAALAELQSANDGDLPVWLTLPVARNGLTPDGVAVVREFLDAGVRVAGVNAMTMNFGDLSGDESLASPIIAALEATHRQLRAIHHDAGAPVGDRTLWRRLGATPMIGRNDVASEVFTLDDARELHRFAHEVGLGRLSVWSANRDRACAAAYADLTVVSESCSGVDQGQESFRAILAADFIGTPSGGHVKGADPTPLAPEDIADDPATSPYPIWDSAASYPADFRVVWRGHVYTARWWNSGAQPDDPALTGDSAPWQLIGPVLEGESPMEVPSLPPDFYPAWDAQRQYDEGDRVMHEGVAFEAQWWTRGDSPAAGQADPGASPWRALRHQEIEQLLTTANH